MRGDERPEHRSPGCGKKRLTGEAEDWLIIAGRLHLTEGEAKEHITASEFVRWQVRLEREWHERTPDQWFAAQTAYEVYLLRWTVSNLFTTKPTAPSLTLEHFLLEFRQRGAPPEQQKKTPDQEQQELQKRMAVSKGAWGSFLAKARAAGASPTGKPGQPPRPTSRPRPPASDTVTPRRATPPRRPPGGTDGR